MAMSKRQPAAVTRERIIDAVAEVLVQRGARGLNVRAVMQHAEVSRTAFYVHFTDMHAAVAAGSANPQPGKRAARSCSYSAISPSAKVK